MNVNAFQRMFVRDVRRFEELERKLRKSLVQLQTLDRLGFIEKQITKETIDIVDVSNDDAYDIMQTPEINELEVWLLS